MVGSLIRGLLLLPMSLLLLHLPKLNLLFLTSQKGITRTLLGNPIPRLNKQKFEGEVAVAVVEA